MSKNRYEENRYEENRNENNRYEDKRYEDNEYDGKRHGSHGRKRRNSMAGLITKLCILAALVFVAIGIYKNRSAYAIDSSTPVGSFLSQLREFAGSHKDSQDSQVKAAAASDENMKNYKNIVLFGVDSTKGDLEDNTRTDSIMVMSISNKTGDVKLVSIYRDTYLNTGSDKYTKCNAAYAYGGSAQAIEMLNSNLDLDIEDYVTIGFGGLVDIIDDIGGITVNVESNEIEHLNNYQSTMAQELGMQFTPVTSAGEQVLNGLQAVGYCRIRYTAGNDFKRAERQRTVLSATMKGIKGSSPKQLMSVASDLMKWTKTSLNIKDMLGIITGSIGSGFNISDTSGFPFADGIATANLGKSKGDCVIPVTLESNVTELHAFLFGTSDYTPSDTVKAYSSQIKNDSAPYM